MPNRPGIFGLQTPAQLEQQRYADAVSLYSNAAPGVALGVMGGQGAGRLLGGLLGVEDPEMEQARRAQELIEELRRDGVNTLAPEGIEEAAKRAERRGMFEVAANMRSQGQKIAEGFLKNQETQLDIQRKQMENEAARASALEYEQSQGWQSHQIALTRQEKATADKRNAINEATAIMRAKGADPEAPGARQRLNAFADALQLQKAVTGGTTQEFVDPVTGEVTSSRSPQLSGSAIDQIYSDLFGEQGRPLAQGGQPLPQGLLPGPQTIPQQYAQGQQPRQLQQAPIKVKQGGESYVPVNLLDEPLTSLEARRLADITGSSNLTLSYERPPGETGDPVTNRARALNLDRKTFRSDIQKPALDAISASKGILSGLNSIAKTIEQEGSATPSAWRRFVDVMRQTSGGVVGDVAVIAADAANSLAQYNLSEQETRVVRKLLGQIQQLRNLEIKRFGGGAPTGADFAIASSILQSPTGVDTARFGPRAFFGSMSNYYNNLLSSIQGDVSDAALRNVQVPAPHKYWALGQAMPDIDPILETIAPAKQAEAIKARTGLTLSRRDMQLLRAEGNLQGSDPIQRGADFMTELVKPDDSPASRLPLGSSDRIFQRLEELKKRGY